MTWTFLFTQINCQKTLRTTCIFSLDLIQKQLYLFYRNILLDWIFRTKFSATEQNISSQHVLGFTTVDSLSNEAHKIWVKVPLRSLLISIVKMAKMRVLLKIQHISKDTGIFKLKICEITPNTLLSNFSRVSNLRLFMSFGNKLLNFGKLTVHLWKKMTWGFTYFDQSRTYPVHAYASNLNHNGIPVISEKNVSAFKEINYWTFRKEVCF